jgi:ABC-type proline/glycine betaine transport system permease subunit
MFDELVKHKNWLRNPTNGKGKYVDPSNRQYLSGKMTLVVIVLYRLGEGLYNLIMSLVFDLLAPLVNAIIGIASDLYHSNPNYTRMAFWGIVGAIQTILSIALAGLVFVVSLFRE